MENSSLGPTQIPRRLANSRPIPGKSAPPAIPCIRGVQQCGNPRAFAKPRGVSASETESHSPLLPSSVESLFPAPRKRLGFFTVVSFPEADGLTSPFPVIATDRKQTGPRCSRLYRLSSARFLTSKIDRDFESGASTPRASNLSRSIWITRCGAQREGYERGFACKFKRCSSKYNCLVFVREEEKLDVLEARED